MDFNLFNISSQDESRGKDNDVFELGLIQRDKWGDILFGIGTLLAWQASSKAEADIIGKRTEQLVPNNNPAKTLSIASWIFLIATLIFTVNSHKRLNEQKSNIYAASAFVDYEKLKTGSMVYLGNLIKVAGFTIVAVGNQLNANLSGNQP